MNGKYEFVYIRINQDCLLFGLPTCLLVTFFCVLKTCFLVLVSCKCSLYFWYQRLFIKILFPHYLSNQPKRTCLSRHLIVLLHYGGVPKEFFLELLMNSLHDAQNARYSKQAALRGNF